MKTILSFNLSFGSCEPNITYSNEITGLLEESFRPQTFTDEPIMAMLGDTLVNSAAAEKIMLLRRGAAKKIADVMSEQLIKAMKSRDTMNGYPLIDEDN